MKRVLFAGAVLAALAALVGQATAAQSAGTINVRLPKHVYGHFRSPDGRVVNAKWGKGPGQVGLVKAEAGPTGGSSFDVTKDVVCVLDQHNSRVLVFAAGKAPQATPLTIGGKAGSVFRGVDSSLAVDTSGTIYVVEPTDSAHAKPTLRSFPSHGGAPLATLSTGGSNPIVRTNGKTAYVAQTLDGPWKASMTSGKAKAGASTLYRPSLDRSRIQVVSGTGTVKLTTSSGKQLTWRISSPDHVSIADAESFGGIEAVVALRVAASSKTEYEVLILSGSGLLDSFSTPDDEYTSTALFDDFRVDGATVYHRGSTAKGLYVDYYSF